MPDSPPHRPPLPPFTTETAVQKARLAEDAWNSRDPARVCLVYTVDSQWRNRTEFIRGRDEIQAFLARKWTRELDYRLIKELWGFRENRMAVRFAYEWRDDSGNWFRSYGNELWQFDADGLMERRIASINDRPINAGDRLFHWDPSGSRPLDPLGCPISLYKRSQREALGALARDADCLRAAPPFQRPDAIDIRAVGLQGPLRGDEDG